MTAVAEKVKRFGCPGAGAHKTPADSPEGFAHISLQQYARNLHGRLLPVHGCSDDSVHPQSALSLADEWIKAWIISDMMVNPMPQQDITDKHERVHIFATMLDFWKRNL